MAKKNGFFKSNKTEKVINISIDDEDVVKLGHNPNQPNPNMKSNQNMGMNNAPIYGQNPGMSSAQENIDIQTLDAVVGIVLDATISFSKVFPKFYYIFKNWIEAFEAPRGRTYNIGYVLTELHDSASVCSIKNSTVLTKEQLFAAVRNLAFYGGAEDGREDIGGAIDNTLTAIENIPENGKKITYGLMVFSDSMPKEKDLERDFTSMERDKLLRFVYVYTYDNTSFWPTFYSGKGGVPFDQQKCSVKLDKLETLLNSSTEEMKNYIDTRVKLMFDQLSIFA